MQKLEGAQMLHFKKTGKLNLIYPVGVKKGGRVNDL